MNEEWKKDPNKRAIAIIRRSSSGQENNTSAETQERSIRKYCDDQGLILLKVNPIIETAYKSSERIKYKKIISDALGDGVRHILFFLSNRETRNLTDNEVNEELVKSDRIVIHHVNERKVFYKGSSDSDWLMRDINAAINKNYSRENSTKLKSALKTKAENGWFPYRHTPLGYIHHKKKDKYGNPIKGTSIIIVNPNRKAVEQVKREFELRSNGFSYESIRKKIIAEGFISPDQVKKYSKHGIEKRLKNSFYRGRFKFGDDEQVYKGKHELIIPEATLQAVDNSFGQPCVKNVNRDRIFDDGWLRCSHPDCGRQITYDPKVKTIKATGKKKTYHYYRCSNSRGIHPSKKYVNESKIWEQFEPAINSLALCEEFAKDIAAVLNENHQKQKSAISNQMQGYRETLQLLEAKEERLFDLLDDGAISKDTYKKRVKIIQKQRSDYTDQLEHLQLQISDAGMASVYKVFELAINALSLWKSMERQERIDYLKQVCSNPVLDDLTIKYHLKKPFAQLAEMKENPEWRRDGDSNPG